MRQFLGKQHSWSCTGWGIAESLIKNHTVDLFSTDGNKNIPANLLPNLIGFSEEKEYNKNTIPKMFGKIPNNNYDVAISYTAMMNFPHYLGNAKNKFGIWCYEWAGKNVLPVGFAKYYKYTDKILAPTNFAKSVFVDSGVPEKHIEVISHGMHAYQYKQNSTIELSNKFKILVNVAQNHLRKNIPGVLEAFGKAFTSKDDVCLILKGKEKKPTMQFDISLNEALADFNKKFPNHAEVKVFSEFLPDISALYRSVDVVFSMSHCEGFYYPGLEALAAGKTVIAPNWGGQLDFLNDSNSLLISGKEERANPKSMYWESRQNAIWFKPSIDDAVDKLKFAYGNFQNLNGRIDVNKIHEQYDWDVITDKILSLC